MNSFIHLIEVIIWPVTILTILFWFRSQLKSNLSRLNSFDASASGVSMSFSERLEQAKQMAQSISVSSTAKDGVGINPGASKNYQELKQLSSKMQANLQAEAQASNIATQGKSMDEIVSSLKESGKMKFEKAQLINSFFELSNAAEKNISDHQLKDLESIYDVITKQ